MKLILRGLLFCAGMSGGFCEASPSPWHPGGSISGERAAMRAEFPPGSCLAGTFISADIQALAIPGVRVRPDAEFWPHHAVAKDWDGNPWHIKPAATALVLAELPRRLRDEIAARLPPNNTFAMIFTGAELIARFGFKAC